jgi:organic radical activating enzyme
MIKTRSFPESNYHSIWYDHKTLRMTYDSKKPITTLKYPEFLDVCITQFCQGACNYCYQDSTTQGKHVPNLIEKFKNYFGHMTSNQKPYQLAFGGGEPTSHPNFIELMKTSHDMGIVPNYTTNGMWVREPYAKQLLDATKKYCGGVAISTHEHLTNYWKVAIDLYVQHNIKLNLHVIISDRQSIDDFIKIYNEYHDVIDYFVLLPHTPVGRADFKEIEWDYFVSKVRPDDQIAFGANFYPYLVNGKHDFDVSLYEPEIMSGYLDMSNMKLYNSSFDLTERNLQPN